MLNNSKIIAWYVATQSEIAKFEQFRIYSMNIEAMVNGVIIVTSSSI